LLLNTRSRWPKRIPWSWYANFIKKAETLISRNKVIGNVIYRIHLRRITMKEVPLCGLNSGDRVIQIGVGSLPQTVLCLAKLGASVEAIDNDPVAVVNASRYLSRFDHDGRVSVRQADGLETDCSAADAVWLSFGVYPKEEVLKRAFASLKEGGRLVYRNPVGLLSHLIPEPRVEPDSIAPSFPVKKVRYFPGMETVVITKTPRKAIPHGEQELPDSVPGALEK
jgi:hypothetical protein